MSQHHSRKALRVLIDLSWHSLNNKSIFFSFIFWGCIIPSIFSIAQAQIIPDNTLPTNSIATPQGNINLIQGGTTAGFNLFHSFQQFSLSTNGTAHFNNALNIQNIFTRITGSSISNIDGTIQANGTANLFLINPNGIIFGPNARLNIGGSFLASTASQINFADETQFSATSPQTTPLLTVSVPVGLQIGINPGTIQVQNVGNSELFPLTNPGLSVFPGQTFALVGGDVTFNGGIVTVPSGRLEIGSVKNSPVKLISTLGGLIFDYTKATNFGDIQLLNRSSLFTPTLVENPFSGIQVVGGQITLDSSQIVALTSGGFNSGNIAINATKSLTLKGNTLNYPFSSWIVNQVAPEAFGNSGEITVNTPQLTILDGAVLQTLSLGFGNVGNVNINADSIQISGSVPFPVNEENSASLSTQTPNQGNSVGGLSGQALNSRISSENNAGGATGTVNVSSRQISLNNGGQIITRTGPAATGQGGNVTVNADRIHAENTDRLRPIFISGIGTYTIGASVGGNVNVSVGQITFSDGGEIFTLTQGTGMAGNITVNASESIVSQGINPFVIGRNINHSAIVGQDVNRSAIIPSGISSSTIASGNTGNITISTPQLTLSQGAGVTTAVFGQLLGNSGPGAGTGNAGDVKINADIIDLIGVKSSSQEEIPQVANFTVGSGNTGNVTISTVASFTVGSGNTGNVTISTRRLRVKDGATLILLVAPTLSAFGQPLPGAGTGTGGTLTVNATESIEVIGESPFLNTPSLIGTQTFGTGNVGEIRINTNRLLIQDGGWISSSTSATGDAGRVTVNAQDILIRGKGQSFQSSIRANAFTATESFQKVFFAPSRPEGNTGEVTVSADRITIQDSGSLSVEHQGTGNAGTLQINTRELSLNQGSITAQTAFGLGGNIILNTPDGLVLRNGSRITVEALGASGDGGNLRMNASTIVALEDSLIRANAVGGNGGNIRIRTQGLFRFRARQISASSQFGVDGVVEIQQPDVDPASGLVKLPQNLLDPNTQVASRCAGVTQGSQFWVTGRGGLPPNPYEMIADEATWMDLRGTETITSTSEIDTTPVTQKQPETLQLIEAQGWTLNPQGQVQLIAQVPVATPSNPNLSPQQSCP